MRAKNFLLPTSDSLFEVKMSPSNLKKLSSEIQATVGIEYEMIIPDVYIRDEDSYPEPDMSEDRRANSISDIIDFFNEGDENSGFELSKLEDRLRSNYDNALDKMAKERWESDDKEYFTKWIRENVPDYEVAQYLEIEYDDPDEIELTGEQWEKFIDAQWEDEGYNYDSAYEEYKQKLIDDEEIEEDDVLREMDIEWMEDVYNNYDINWPYREWNGEDPDEVYSELASELQNYVMYDVDYSTSYHGGYKTNDAYMIEPDSSISPDDVGAGIEVVSPPLPLEEAFDELKNVLAWANTKDAYTNGSTGLHINVSVPGYSTDKLDFVKLALLSGDKYVLEQFDRMANTFAVSALDKIGEYSTDTDKELFFRALKGKMDNITSRILHPASTDKYTSINVQSNRIEFRGPGGDWMSKNITELENTVRRFVVALDAALDPSKYQEEYLKKLTKVFSPRRGSTEEVFVKYSAGALSKDQLKQELEKLRSSKGKYKLMDKGIIPISYDELKIGDWIIEQPMENNEVARAFLKRTRDIDTAEKALSAALEITNDFDTGRIEDISAKVSEGSNKYIVYERGYPFMSRYDIYSETPLMAVQRARQVYRAGDDLELTAARRGTLDYRPTNAALLDRSQQIYAIVSHISQATGSVYQCVMSGNSPQNAISRAKFWLGAKFDPDSYDVKAYPIEEYSRENPNNDPKKLKIYSVDGSEYQEERIIVATSKKQAVEVFEILTNTNTEDLGTILVHEWEKSNPGDLESYLKSQNGKLYIKAGGTGEYLDVSAGILPKEEEPDGMRDYRVNNKDATYGGVVIRAASPLDAIEEARRRFHILPHQELVAVPEF